MVSKQCNVTVVKVTIRFLDTSVDPSGPIWD